VEADDVKEKRFHQSDLSSAFHLAHLARDRP
jgi:hypothetical protein